MFFVSHAETLFLVDDYESEIVEYHVFRYQAVRADDDIDLFGSQVLDDLILLPGTAETREHFHSHWKDRKPLAEGVEMLLGEDSCRDQHRNLFAIGNRFEGSPQGDFGLSVPDVTAEQPVHRTI